MAELCRLWYEQSVHQYDYHLTNRTAVYHIRYDHGSDFLYWGFLICIHETMQKITIIKPFTLETVAVCRCRFANIQVPIMNIRQSHDLIFIMVRSLYCTRLVEYRMKLIRSSKKCSTSRQVNSLRSMGRSSMIQVMVCSVVDAKPSLNQGCPDYQLVSQEHISVKF